MRNNEMRELMPRLSCHLFCNIWVSLGFRKHSVNVFGTSGITQDDDGRLSSETTDAQIYVT